MVESRSLNGPLEDSILVCVVRVLVSSVLGPPVHVVQPGPLDVVVRGAEQSNVERLAQVVLTSVRLVEP